MLKITNLFSYISYFTLFILHFISYILQSYIINFYLVIPIFLNSSALFTFCVVVFINSLSSKSIRTQNCNIFPDLDMRKLIYRKGYIVEHKGYNHRNGFVLTNIATFKKILSLQEKTEYERR